MLRTKACKAAEAKKQEEEKEQKAELLAREEARTEEQREQEKKAARAKAKAVKEASRKRSERKDLKEDWCTGLGEQGVLFASVLGAGGVWENDQQKHREALALNALVKKQKTAEACRAPSCPTRTAVATQSIFLVRPYAREPP